MLPWTNDRESGGVELQTVVDDREMIQAKERRPMTMSNRRISPYTGHMIIRRFLVVHEGIRSSYCL